MKVNRQKRLEFHLKATAVEQVAEQVVMVVVPVLVVNVVVH